DTSYTNQQLNWLNNTLALFPNYKKVLFHHYDFQDQLSLAALGIDMSLWGHIHYNDGSISVQPYNLATRSTCDGNRAYRVVRINNGQMTPYNTIYAGATGNNLSVQYSPSNYGVADSVKAIITNNQPLAFENAQLQFIMPKHDTGYNVSGGTLIQVDTSGVNNVCYVRISLSANSSAIVTVTENGVANFDPVQVPTPLKLKSIYPNPLKTQGNLLLYSDKAFSELTLQLFNLKGQIVYQEPLKGISRGESNFSFTIPAELCSGIYFLRFKEDRTQVRKILVLQ
ncbi:MAG TPA: T9SS type A sorting domain-containing protein, partial [Candidatus Cloacimonas sp.]|nr:T9SS type A sorting domain-containing protein [Candidatus Cloacimonas sp.]